MNPLSQSERTLSQSKALEYFNRELDARQWTLKEFSIGKEIPTVFTEIYDCHGNLVQDGMGKGVGLQGFLSARYEALEHSVTDLTHKFIDGIWCGSLKEGLHQKFYPIPDSLPLETFAVHSLWNLKSYWKTFKSSFDSKTYLYPLSKMDPFSSYDNLYPEDLLYKKIQSLAPWIRNNNGTAIGSSEEEAFLHALNESIERYGIASTYVTCILKDQPAPLNIIRRDSLSENITQLAEVIENEQNIHLEFVDITTELKVPTFAVKALSIENQVVAIGYGASLNSDYALERGLLECQQLLHVRTHDLYGKNNEEEGKVIRSKLLEWSKLNDAIDLNAPFRKWFHYHPRSYPDLDVQGQITHLLKILKRANVEVFRGKTYQSPHSSLCAVKVIVPSFSDFSFIASGLPVVPSGRVLERFYEHS